MFVKIIAVFLSAIIALIPTCTYELKANTLAEYDLVLEGVDVPYYDYKKSFEHEDCFAFLDGEETQKLFEIYEAQGCDFYSCSFKKISDTTFEDIFNIGEHSHTQVRYCREHQTAYEQTLVVSVINGKNYGLVSVIVY